MVFNEGNGIKSQRAFVFPYPCSLHVDRKIAQGEVHPLASFLEFSFSCLCKKEKAQTLFQEALLFFIPEAKLTDNLKWFNTPCWYYLGISQNPNEQFMFGTLDKHNLVVLFGCYSHLLMIDSLWLLCSGVQPTTWSGVGLKSKELAHQR